VDAGYLRDEYAQFFVHPAHAQRRAPIINRGTCARISALRVVIRRFLELAPSAPAAAAATPGRQVLVLGAGFDTAVFQLQQEGVLAGVGWFELDFPDIVQHKSRIIAGTPALTASLCGSAAPGRLTVDAGTHELTVAAGCDTDEEGGLSRGQYSLLAVDLSELDRVKESLAKAGFDPTLPTLVVSECVLIYMEPEDSDALIDWVGTTCPRAAFVIYEQISPHDPFGRTMVRNIASRGCPLKSIARYPALEDMCERFRIRGWSGCVVGKDMDIVYRNMLDEDDKRRTERLEMFDEFEEWHLLMQHYCLLYAATTSVDETEHAAAPVAVTADQAELTNGKQQRCWLEVVGDPVARA
jgi:tRNA wybutosine-synthesizing protein 4